MVKTILFFALQSLILLSKFSSSIVRLLALGTSVLPVSKKNIARQKSESNTDTKTKTKSFLV